MVVACTEPLVPVTVTVYSPGVVPLCASPATSPLLTAQPLAPTRNAPSRKTTSRARHVRRRGTKSRNSAASALPPPRPNKERWRATEGGGDVDRVRVAVTACVPVTAGGWLTEQAGGSTGLDGLVAMAHARATGPVKPPLGVMVMVEVPVAPADAMLMAEPLRANWPVPGPVTGGSTVMSTVVEALMVPDFPVTFME